MPAPRRALYPLAGAWCVAMALFPWGAMQQRHLKTMAGRYDRGREWQVVGLRESLDATIIYVEELIFGGGHQSYRLVTNSLSMSTTEFQARRYPKLYVYLPVAVHANLRSALLISHGVGSTAKALTETRSFESKTTVARTGRGPPRSHVAGGPLPASPAERGGGFRPGAAPPNRGGFQPGGVWGGVGSDYDPRWYRGR